MIKRFEDVVAWQKSQELCIFIYTCFRNCKDYSFRDQIQRASVSVMNNIAEGFERNTNKELKHFLYVAKGSCGEVRSMSYLACRVCFISSSQEALIQDKCEEISKILSGFIKKII